jgi:hypothetical protein
MAYMIVSKFNSVGWRVGVLSTTTGRLRIPIERATTILRRASHLEVFCSAAAPSRPSAATPHTDAPSQWSGLPSWRASSIDARRRWGPKKGREVPLSPSSSSHPPATTLAECGLRVLLAPDPADKAALTHAAWRAFHAGAIPVGAVPPISVPARPARPPRPELVPARMVPGPANSPLPLNAHLLHNLTHVELNAVDLAWDTVVRFSGLGLPTQFYTDFAR